MALVFAVLGLSMHIIFLFKRELLFEKKPFLIFFTITSTLFLLAYFFIWKGVGDPKFIRFLRVPFLTLSIFFVMKSVYLEFFEKNAEDTFWSMNPNLMKDGIFNALFWFLGFLIPLFLTYKVLWYKFLWNLARVLTTSLEFYGIHNLAGWQKDLISIADDRVSRGQSISVNLLSGLARATQFP